MTIGVLIVFAFAAHNIVEEWPITSFRLFSNVRTAHGWSTTLIAIDEAGHDHPVRADRHHEFVVRTKHEYTLLRSATPTKAHAMVDAWLRSADMDPDDYTAVELHRTARLYSADGATSHVTSERTIWHLDL